MRVCTENQIQMDQWMVSEFWCIIQVGKLCSIICSTCVLGMFEECGRSFFDDSSFHTTGTGRIFNGDAEPTLV